jgi:hypothetical protein
MSLKPFAFRRRKTGVNGKIILNRGTPKRRTGTLFKTASPPFDEDGMD